MRQKCNRVNHSIFATSGTEPQAHLRVDRLRLSTRRAVGTEDSHVMAIEDRKPAAAPKGTPRSGPGANDRLGAVGGCLRAAFVPIEDRGMLSLLSALNAACSGVKPR